jgi:Tol biopolymer transport system component
LHLRAAAPAWSPDGTQLAFSGEAGISELGGIYDQGSGVWLVDIVEGEAQNAKQLVNEVHVSNIAWSPDGTKLAFEVAPPGLPHEIRVIKAGNGQEISRFPGEQPAWYSDNQKLIIKICAPDCGLWQVGLDGRKGQQITSGDTDSYPIWSPTGEYLAFSSHRDGDWEIYLLRPGDGELRRLTRRSGTDTTPVFDSCGQELYLRTDVYGGWRVTVMKLDGSDERKVQEGVGPSDDWGLARPAVH